MTRTLDHQASNPKPPKPAPTRRKILILRTINITASIALIALALTALWQRRIDPMGGWSALGTDILFILAAIALTASTFALWLFRLFTCRETSLSRAISAISFIAPIVIALLTATLAITEVPFRLAFACSRPALEQAITEVRADPEKGKTSRTLGVLPVDSIQIETDEAKVYITNAGFDADVHLALDPAGTFPRATRTEPLGHDWYFVIGY